MEEVERFFFSSCCLWDIRFAVSDVDSILLLKANFDCKRERYQHLHTMDRKETFVFFPPIPRMSLWIQNTTFCIPWDILPSPSLPPFFLLALPFLSSKVVRILPSLPRPPLPATPPATSPSLLPYQDVHLVHPLHHSPFSSSPSLFLKYIVTPNGTFSPPPPSFPTLPPTLLSFPSKFPSLTPPPQSPLQPQFAARRSKRRWMEGV